MPTSTSSPGAASTVRCSTSPAGAAAGRGWAGAVVVGAGVDGEPGRDGGGAVLDVAGGGGREAGVVDGTDVTGVAAVVGGYGGTSVPVTCSSVLGVVAAGAPTAVGAVVVPGV